jgi:hypothetical protein
MMLRVVTSALLLLAPMLAAATQLGKPLTVKQPMTIAQLMTSPDNWVGKTVQVKGKVSEVCQMAGCWMQLVDQEGKAVRIKVKDGEIVFPKDAVGKMALAEGKFAKIELTKEQAIDRARHEAEENGKPFNPESIKSGMTIYQIQGTGATLLE